MKTLIPQMVSGAIAIERRWTGSCSISMSTVGGGNRGCDLIVTYQKAQKKEEHPECSSAISLFIQR